MGIIGWFTNESAVEEASWSMALLAAECIVRTDTGGTWQMHIAVVCKLQREAAGIGPSSVGLTADGHNILYQKCFVKFPFFAKKLVLLISL